VTIPLRMRGAQQPRQGLRTRCPTRDGALRPGTDGRGRRRARAPSPSQSKDRTSGVQGRQGERGRAHLQLTPRQSWPGLSRGTRDAARVLGVNVRRRRGPSGYTRASQRPRAMSYKDLGAGRTRRLGGLTAHRAAGQDIAGMLAHGHRRHAHLGEEGSGQNNVKMHAKTRHSAPRTCH
jgi:hypothetical protein